DDADQGAGFQIKPGTGPHRAEDRLLGNLGKFFHERVGVETLVELVGVGVAHELAAHRAAFGAQRTVGHCGSGSCVGRGEACEGSDAFTAASHPTSSILACRAQEAWPLMVGYVPTCH